MSQAARPTFFAQPILDSPYAYPGRHWRLDADGQPTNELIESRRCSDLVTPVPKAKKRKTPKGPTAQVELALAADDEGLSTAEQKYDPTPIINELRGYVDTSDWEAEFCRVAEAHPRVRAYVKNHSLGFEVPYRMGGTQRHYRPDFIVQIIDKDGLNGDSVHDDPLNLVVEIKGFRGEDAAVKAETMLTQWVTGVNALGTWGRWAFAEFRSAQDLEADFDRLVRRFVGSRVPA